MDGQKVFKRITRVNKSSAAPQPDSASAPFTSICVNPLDRLCDLLLSWNLREDLVSNLPVDASHATASGLSDNKPKNTFKKIPSTFPDGYASYLRTFEPFVMEEIKANVLSKVLAKSFSSLQKGYTYLYQESGVSTVMPIIQLNCNKLFWNPGNICSINNNSYKNGITGMVVMDLVLLSLDTCDCAPSASPFFARDATLTSVTGKGGGKAKFLLGVVTGRTKTYSSAQPGQSEDASYTYSINVSRSQWEDYKFNRKQVLKEQQKLGKWTAEGAVAPSACASSGTAAAATAAVKANICVLDGLTSSWREFLALHQMHYSPMLPFTLDPLHCPSSGSTESVNAEQAPSGAAGLRISSANPGNVGETPPQTPEIDLTEDGPEREAPRSVGLRRFQILKADGTELPRRSTSASGDTTTHVGAENPDLNTESVRQPSEPDEAALLSIALPRQFSGDAPCFSPLSASPVRDSVPPEELVTSSSSSTSSAPRCRGRAEKSAKVQNSASISSSFRHISSKYSRIFTSTYNKSQLTAIESACDVDESGELNAGKSGFVLIQGPPGTGKTHTVLGLLNTLHLKQYNCFYARVVKEVMGSRGLACRCLCRALATGADDASTSNGIIQWLNLLAEISVHHKPHVLVTAPSNTAIDNICSRVVAKGFVDGNGSQYYPYIVRAKSNSGGSGGDNRTILLEEATDKIVNIPLKQREAQLSELKRSIRQLLVKLCHVQNLLLALASSYNEWYVLHCTAAGNSKSVHNALRGYELRVDRESAKSYWVDHVKQVSVAHPLPPAAGTPPATEFPDYSVGIDSLPDYRVHTQALTHLVDQIVLANISFKRLIAIREVELGGTRHPGQRTSTDSRSKSFEIRKIVEQSIIQEAHIVLTTLNSVGLSSLDDSQFPIVIVDEAGQCVEPSVMIPLSRVNCKRAVLVGDPMQLPATLFSSTVRQCGYDTSLLERLISGGHVVHLLNTQYRMIPEISEFPSTMFYNGRVLNGKNVCDPQYRPKFIKSAGTKIDYRMADETDEGNSGYLIVKCNTSHNASIRLNPAAATSPKYLVKSRFPGFAFFDLLTSRDQQLRGSSGTAMSRSNPEEAKFCLGILQALMREIALVGDVFSVGHVGVITPYQEQVNELSSLFRAAGYFPPAGKTRSFAVPVSVPQTQRVSGASAKLAQRGFSRGSTPNGGESASTTTKYITIDSIDFNSVDGFQGREKDIVIISCVRANDGNSIGFLSDTRRMNVVLTRARFGLYVVGSQDTLRSNKVWGKLINHAKEKQSLIVVPNADVDVAATLEGQPLSDVAGCGNAADNSNTSTAIDRLVTQARTNYLNRGNTNTTGSGSGVGIAGAKRKSIEGGVVDSSGDSDNGAQRDVGGSTNERPRPTKMTISSAVSMEAGAAAASMTMTDTDTGLENVTLSFKRAKPSAPKTSNNSSTGGAVLKISGPIEHLEDELLEDGEIHS